MILLQQSYRSPQPERQSELDHVRRVNAAVGAFESVAEVDGAARRWTFGDFFRLAGERFPGRICVLANSDIAFDESIAAALPLARAGGLVALSRWDDDAAPSMEGRVAGAGWHFFSHSQDAWIFEAGGLPPFEAEFQLGIPQCESRLAYEAARAGVVIVNPALSIHARHHHVSAVRSWRRKDGYRGPFLFPRLTSVAVETPEAIVVERRGRFRKLEAVVRLTGAAEDFRRELESAAASNGLWNGRIGLRSPFYRRGGWWKKT